MYEHTLGGLTQSLPVVWLRDVSFLQAVQPLTSGDITNFFSWQLAVLIVYKVGRHRHRVRWSPATLAPIQRIKVDDSARAFFVPHSNDSVPL